MIEVNLLPDEMKKERSGTAEPVRLGLTFALPVLGLLIIFNLVLFAIVTQKHGKLKRLSAEAKSLEDDKNKADQLREDSGVLLEKLDMLEKMTAKKMAWAPKLNALTNVLPPEIWLSNISVVEEKTKKMVPAGKETKRKHGKNSDSRPKLVVKEVTQKRLVITGFVVPVPGSGPLGPVGKLIDALKADPGFFGDFEDVQQGRIARERVSDLEVTGFELICPLKELQ